MRKGQLLDSGAVKRLFSYFHNAIRKRELFQSETIPELMIADIFDGRRYRNLGELSAFFKYSDAQYGNTFADLNIGEIFLSEGIRVEAHDLISV